MADGWVATGTTPPSTEDIREHLGAIEDRSSFVVPKGTFDEVRIATERVAEVLEGS